MKNLKMITNDNNNDSEDEEIDDSDELLEVMDNHIYFYNDVCKKSIFKLVVALEDINRKLLYKKETTEGYDPIIYLHINSYGGEVFDCMAAVDYIKRSIISPNSLRGEKWRETLIVILDPSCA